MAISVVLAVDTIADELVAKIAERIPSIKVGPGTEPDNEMGPLITGEHRDKVARLRRRAPPTQGATVVVDGRDGAPADGFFLKPDAARRRHAGHGGLRRRDLRAGPVGDPGRQSYDEGLELINANPYGNGTAIFTRDGGAARQFQFDVDGRHGRHQRADPGAGQLLQLRRLEGQPVRRHPHVRPRGRQLLHPRARSSPRRWPDPAHVAPSTSASPRTAEPMDLGVVLQTTPPSARVVDLAKRAETVRVQPRLDVRQPHPVAGAVRHLQPDPRRDPQRRRRADGHQPGHPRLDGHRQRCSPRSTRCTATAPSAASAAATRRCASPTASRPRSPRCASRSTSSASSPTAAVVDYKGSTITLPVGRHEPARGVGRRRTGPRRSRSPARSATASSCSSPTRRSRRGRSRAVREAAADRRARPRRASRSASPRPAYVGDDVAHRRDQCRWFGGMVGNHVADIVGRYGDVVRRARGAHRLHRGPPGLRLQPARPGRQHPRRLRARRDRRPLLHPRPGRRAPAPPRTSCATSASTSSPSTSSTTTRTPPCRPTASTSSRRSPSTPLAKTVSRPSCVRKARDCSSSRSCWSRSAWELYKADRARTTGGRVLGVLDPAAAHATTTRCPTCGTWARAVRRPRAARRTGRSGRSCWRRRGTRSGSPSPASRSAPPSGSALAAVMARFELVRRGLLPYLVVSQTVPHDRPRPARRQLGRQAAARSAGSGRGGCRWRCSARSSPSSRSPSARCAASSRRRRRRSS